MLVKRPNVFNIYNLYINTFWLVQILSTTIDKDKEDKDKEAFINVAYLKQTA